MKRFKKVLAGMLATSMVLGMSVTALADDTSGSGTGTGAFEGHVDTDIIKVTLPTVSENDTIFNYIMDPEGLIAATDNAKYSGATFEEDANVFFLSGENTYTSKSASLKVINRGTVAVDVTVKAETAANASVAMVSSSAFGTDDTNAELYLGLNVAGQDEVAILAAGSESAAEVTVGLLGNDDNYEVTYTEEDAYTYAEKEGLADTAWNSFEFYLTGACNPYGDYSSDELAAASVTVTWSYAEREEGSTAVLLEENATSDAAPSIAVTSYKIADCTEGLTIDVDFGTGESAGTAMTGVKYSADGTTYKAFSNASNVTYDNTAKTITVSASYISPLTAQRWIRVYFDNSETKYVEFTFTTE